MKKALEGLKGVAQVDWDLSRDLFQVTQVEGSAPSLEALFGAVRELGYTPNLVDASTFRPTADAVNAAARMPELVRKALDRAKTDGKRFLLVDCMGDN